MHFLTMDGLIRKLLPSYAGGSPDLSAHLSYMYGSSGRTVTQLLNCPKPVHTIPSQKVKPKPSSRVITGAEFLRELEEKEQKKAEEAFRKEERKHLRTLKKSQCYVDVNARQSV